MQDLTAGSNSRKQAGRQAKRGWPRQARRAQLTLQPGRGVGRGEWRLGGVDRVCGVCSSGSGLALVDAAGAASAAWAGRRGLQTRSLQQHDATPLQRTMPPVCHYRSWPGRKLYLKTGGGDRWSESGGTLSSSVNARRPRQAGPEPAQSKSTSGLVGRVRSGTWDGATGMLAWGGPRRATASQRSMPGPSSESRESKADRGWAALQTQSGPVSRWTSMAARTGTLGRRKLSADWADAPSMCGRPGRVDGDGDGDRERPAARARDSSDRDPTVRTHGDRPPTRARPPAPHQPPDSDDDDGDGDDGAETPAAGRDTAALCLSAGPPPIPFPHAALAWPPEERARAIFAVAQHHLYQKSAHGGRDGASPSPALTPPADREPFLASRARASRSTSPLLSGDKQTAPLAPAASDRSADPGRDASCHAAHDVLLRAQTLQRPAGSNQSGRGSEQRTANSEQRADSIRLNVRRRHPTTTPRRGRDAPQGERDGRTAGRAGPRVWAMFRRHAIASGQRGQRGRLVQRGDSGARADLVSPRAQMPLAATSSRSSATRCPLRQPSTTARLHDSTSATTALATGEGADVPVWRAARVAEHGRLAPLKQVGDTALALGAAVARKQRQRQRQKQKQTPETETKIRRDCEASEDVLAAATSRLERRCWRSSRDRSTDCSHARTLGVCHANCDSLNHKPHPANHT
ncbi:hypothetical protein BDV95DRAFT_663230 [Massariosphaeria phaeospora]|uniref:Uncharacterized protein n=1 Tax=Massariosphaeria phaeospora TaxID=100035 RepID=A0A7C8IEZ1_9PLEO|nr:hypothetical protein BDV95DRAFT_663230 [Massariosphaeria phaeospora]